MAELVQTEYALLILQPKKVSIGQFAVERMTQLANSTDATMFYADYNEEKDETTTAHPLIAYQDVV